MSAETKRLNPFLTALVITALVAFTLAAVFAGAANAQASAPLDGLSPDGLWIAAGCMLALGTASTLAALTAAAVRWQPRPTDTPDAGWSISYPDREQ